MHSRDVPALVHRAPSGDTRTSEAGTTLVGMDHAELPRRPFTASDARGLGLTRGQLERAVADGRVEKPMRGVYLAADVESTPLLRAQAASLVIGDSSVVCDRSAAWLWGVDCLRFAELDGTPALESCVLRGHQATERDEVAGVTRDLCPADWVELGGVRVTTPLRTAADLGCRLWAPHALGAMDALARAHGFGRQDLRRLLPRYRGRRGVVQLRALVATLDPRAESQPESWVRWFILAEGLTRPRAAGLGHGRGSFVPPRPGVPAGTDPGGVRR